MKSPITTHILDTSLGQPAQNVQVSLFKKNSEWEMIAESQTDNDGRVTNFNIPEGIFQEGVYQLRFDTDVYFKRQDLKTFYPHVTLVFSVHDIKQHYHVPLLLNCFGYSTYRGS